MNGPVKMNAEMNLVQYETGFAVVDDFFQIWTYLQRWRTLRNYSVTLERIYICWKIFL